MTTYNFEAEISQLLSIIINNFYSEKDIFLRELISNASDAIDKLRHEHLQNPEANVLGENTEFRIRIIPDNEHNQLIIEDSGIGMTQDDLIQNLGTIAHSGTKNFMNNVNSGDVSSLIGKFGVGFYSAFLVANKVDVYSKHYLNADTYCWSSDAKGLYTVSKIDDDNLKLERGSRLVLHLRDDQKQYLDENILKDIINRHSQFISYPIYLQVIKTKEPEYEEDEEDEEDQVNLDSKANENNENNKNNENNESNESNEDVILEGEEEMKQFNLEEVDETKPEPAPETYTEFEVLNKSVPIWMKPKNEITEEQYNEFYKTISNDWEDPLINTHFQVEGNIVFRGLLYIPSKAPFDLFQSKQKMDNIKLYVRRVFITDDCHKFVPEYLSFVKGVIDSDDLPLNVSREMLQYNKVFESIKRQLTKKVIDMLINLAEDEEKYNTFYSQFSKNIKLGVHEDGDRRQKLAQLLRYQSTTSQGKLTSLDKYVENMKEGQNDIYYITGDNLESVATSTHLDVFRRKNIEVLFMVEPIDEYCVNQMVNYKEHNLVNVTRQNIELPASEDEKKEFEEHKTNYKSLCEKIQSVLGGQVSSVTVSNRLVQEPCCVSVGQHGWTANMEKIMKAQAMSDANMLNFMKSQRCLEINPNHRIIKSLYESIKDKDEVDVGSGNLICLLYETALQDSGFSVDVPRNYAHRVYSMIELGLGYGPTSDENVNNDNNENVNNENNENLEIPVPNADSVVTNSDYSFIEDNTVEEMPNLAN